MKRNTGMSATSTLSADPKKPARLGRIPGQVHTAASTSPPSRTQASAVLLKSSHGSVNLNGVPEADERVSPAGMGDFRGFSSQDASPTLKRPAAAMPLSTPQKAPARSPQSSGSPFNRKDSAPEAEAMHSNDERARQRLEAEMEGEIQALREDLQVAVVRATEAESERDELGKVAEYNAVRCTTLAAELSGLREEVEEERVVLVNKAAKLAEQATKHNALEQAVRTTGVGALLSLAANEGTAADVRKRVEKMAKEPPLSVLDYVRVKLRLYLMRQVDDMAEMQDRLDRSAARYDKLEKETADLREELALRTANTGVEAEVVIQVQTALKKEITALRSEHEDREEALIRRTTAIEMQRRTAERKVEELHTAAQERDAALEEVAQLRQRLHTMASEAKALSVEKAQIVKERNNKVEQKIQHQQDRLCQSAMLITKHDEQLLTLSKRLKQAKSCTTHSEVKALRNDKACLEHQLQLQRKHSSQLRQEASSLKRTVSRLKKETDDMRGEYQVFFAAHLREQEYRRQREERQEKEEWRVKQKHHASEEALEYYKTRLHVTQHESKILSRQFKKCLLTEQRERVLFAKERKHLTAENNHLKATAAAVASPVSTYVAGLSPAAQTAPPIAIPASDDEQSEDTDSADIQDHDSVLDTNNLSPLEAVDALNHVPHTMKKDGKPSARRKSTLKRPQSAPPRRLSSPTSCASGRKLSQSIRDSHSHDVCETSLNSS